MHLSPAELSTRLRAHGLRVTPQRLHIYGALVASGEHLTPDGVMEAVRPQHPSISLNTVYEVLETLTTLGVIQRADVGAGSRRYDANMEPHHHMVCRNCGRQVDVPCRAVTGDCIDRGAIDDEETRGFEVESAQIIFFGRCDACATVNKRDTKAATI